MTTSSFASNRKLAYNLVFSAFLLGAACLAAHLFFLGLHPINRNYYTRKVEQRWHSYEVPQGKRGNILFRDGTLLAGSRKVAKVIVEPGLVNNFEDVCLTLAQHLGRPAEDIRAEINECRGRNVDLATGVDIGTALKIDRAALRGVFTRYYYERTYPHRDYCAAATVGFAGLQPVHRLGLEATFDEQLTGRNGKVIFRKDSSRKRLPGSELESDSKEDGRDLTTTLHAAIQTVCEDELRRAQQSNQAQWGCILVMEPDSGQVLGAATYPSFDPNEYVKGRIGRESNLLVHSPVEPGSTIKPLLAAYALDQDWISPSEKYVCNRLLTIGRYRVKEAELSHMLGGNGGVCIDEILIESSNIGMAKVALNLGQDRVLQAYEALGFFAKSGIELPVESSGLKPCSWMDSSETWPKITLANTGFGQGMSVTPVQLAAAYCALANGGYRVHPTLVISDGESSELKPLEEELSLPEGEIILAGMGDGLLKPRTEKPRAAAEGRVRVLSPETCEQVTGWLEKVVSEGTGKKAQLARFTAAGKTGTAQIPSPRGGYKSGAYLASFVGYFPSREPRYLVLVMFNQPRGAYYGGSVAAPVFKRVGDRISCLDQLAGPET